MNNQIVLPMVELNKIMETYNENMGDSIEFEILFKNKKKISEKTLKKINAYFNKKSSKSETQYILDISLLTDKNKRLSIKDNYDMLQDHCNIERLNIEKNQANFPDKYNLEEKTFISSVELNSIDAKINLKTEREITDEVQKTLFMSSFNKILKTYRYKKRITYIFDKYKIDITLVKMGKEQNIFLAKLDKQVEDIELEIEYTSKEVMTMEVLKNMIKDMTLCNQIINEGYFNINKNESLKIISSCKAVLEKDTFLQSFRNNNIKIGPKPVSLTKNTIIHMLEKTGNENIEGSKKTREINEIYKITEKADGERYFMFIDKELKIYLINSNNNVIKTGLQLLSDKFKETVLDGELIIIDRKYEYKYFDIYMKNNKVVYSKTLEERIVLMNELNNEINNENEINTEKCVSYIEEKKNIRSSMKEYKNISEFTNTAEAKDYKIDGVIFMYNDGLGHMKNIKDMSILKYKPLKQNSIDVLLLDKILYCSYIVRNKNRRKQFPVKSQIMCTKPYIVDLHTKPVMKMGLNEEIDYDSLNNKIIEIVYNPEKEYFELEKIRYDKTIEYMQKNSIAGLANDFSVVNDILGHSFNPIEETFLNNITINELENLKKYVTRPNAYYGDEDGSRANIESEKKLKKINNSVKRDLINDAVTILKKNDEMDIKVLEIGCGRGGDIAKYISTNFHDGIITPDKLHNNGVKFILGIDIDSKSIEYIDSNGNDNRSRGRFIGMKNDYMKNENVSDDIPDIYKNNTAYFMTGDLNNYNKTETNLENSYEQIMTDLKHDFGGGILEDNNLDFDKRTQYELNMLRDINMLKNINIDLFINEQFELISCQFAIHYIDLEIFCKYIDLQLKQGGMFICTFMEKTKVLNLLGDKDEVGGKFWSLRKNINPDLIDVKFKTANSKYMEERFMTMEKLENELGKYNIKLYSNDMESIQSSTSSIKNTRHFGELKGLQNETDFEFEFNKLYTGVIFQKTLSSTKKLQSLQKLTK